ncbi:hypothetical protein DBV05_g12128 [Lasiodiplodia theobromae]|uniref:Protein kinase domain-containing protein n=1 Tax=Lasiodiplodia theobromae TaxID=45133 RepID=A0A5N5CV26_9PEZI|nr:hypothetical protein DBV05_g12128 [Lasiodiplodia theobromae]
MVTGIEIASIALASAGAAHQLFDCGLRIYQRIKNEQQLNLLLRELQMFEIEDRYRMLDNYVQAAQPILFSALVEEEDKDQLLRQWERIKEYLINVNQLIDTMITNSSILETWARHKARDKLRNMGGTKMLIGLLQDFQNYVSFFEKKLTKHPLMLLSGRDFTYIDGGSRVPLMLDLFIRKGRLNRTSDGNPAQIQSVLVESKPLQQNDDERVMEEDVATLANKIARAQPNRGIFRLLGFRKEINRDYCAFELVFGGSFDGPPPMNLSTCMQTHPTKPSLNFRVNLCCQLATAVFETQTLGLVHKNIRPENILVLEAERSPLATPDEAIPVINLCGWQYSRHVENGYITTLTNDVTLQRKIYQHPQRQLPMSDCDYSMAHDVYSLGVCMLEILCWKSILQRGPDAEQPPTVSQDFIEAFTALRYAPNQADPADRYTKFPRNNKAVLLRMNKTHVPVEAGTKMCHIIHGFLTCLDRNRESGYDDGEAEEGEYVLTGENERRIQARKFMDTGLKDLQNVLRAI